MSNKIIENAYRVLGLLPNSTTKEISKRLKNIDKLLKIGNIPDFNFDFNYYNQLRTEENISVIRNVLFNPQEQILHYFFSIYLQSEEQLIQMKEIENNFTIEKINEYYEERSDMISCKNSAILMYLFLFFNKDLKNECTTQLIEKNLILWHQILFSNQMFKNFKKLYLVDDEIGISEELIDDLQNELQQDLVNAYSELAEVRNEQEIILELVKVFKLKDSNVIVKQVEDCYKNIDNAIEILDSMNISEDGVFDDNEKKTLKENLTIIQNNLNILKDYDLYEDSKTIVLRDRIVKIIRKQILDLHNNLSEKDTSLKLINFAIKICGTEGLKLSLKEEKNLIKDNINFDKNKKKLNDINKLFDKAEKQLVLLKSSDIKELKVEVYCLYEEIKDKSEKLAEIIFYKFLHLAIDINNSGKYFEALELIEISSSYAKNQETKTKYLENYKIITNNINNSLRTTSSGSKYVTGCFGTILYNIVVYVIILLIGAACTAMWS